MSSKPIGAAEAARLGVAADTCGAANADAVEPKCRLPRVRDRIFASARDLFSRYGLRGVGVDAIACDAGTNKMSFYRNFASKDDLVAECLQESEREFWEWWDQLIGPLAGQPRKQIETLFDGFVTKVCNDEDRTRGCALANAIVEIPDLEHPGRKVTVEFKARVRDRFGEMAREMNARDPEVLADGLLLLMDGSYLSRLAFGDEGPIKSAGKAALALMDHFCAGQDCSG